MVEMHPISDTPQEGAAPAGGAYISARLRNPDATAPKASSGNYIVAGICAIVATIAFLVMLFMLWQDYQALSFA